MTDEKRQILLENEIEQSIHTAREADVPEGFEERVMTGLASKRPSVWTRFRLWLVRPQVMTFRPMTVIPAVTMAVALLALAIIKMDAFAPEDGVRLATVCFVMHDESLRARNVSVVGSFNNWQAGQSVMWYDEDKDAWILETQLPPGDHEYLFVVNGQDFVQDPLAPMTRDDGFGNRNSILFVGGDDEQVL